MAVSIPLKREGTFRPDTELPVEVSSTPGFNSLQTGRHIQTAPLANPVTVRAKLAISKRDRISTFF